MHGLCPKHNMRLRRTGDPNVVRRPGRPRNQERAEFRAMFASASWSPRTLERLWTAWQVLTFTGGAEAVGAALIPASRPNGSVNVAEMERQARRALVEWVIAHPDERTTDDTP